MKSTLALFTLFTLSSLYFLPSIRKQSQQLSFDSWKKEYNTIISDTQQPYRMMVFAQNLILIQKHNSNPFRSYDMGVNQFTHLTPQQFVALYLQSPQQKTIDTTNHNLKSNYQDVDWQVLGKVSPVKNQGQCDAGYAFCSSSLTESSLLFQNNSTLLSQQQIIDCSQNYTTFGCKSGSRSGTLMYIRDMGLNPQSTYGYKGVKGNCLKSTGQYKLREITQAQGCDAMRGLLNATPVTVAVNAMQWQSYRSGVFDSCNDADVNHDVFLVGATLTYWRIKNSWGKTWGEYGYIRLKIGNMCGICTRPAFGFK